MQKPLYSSNQGRFAEFTLIGAFCILIVTVANSLAWKNNPNAELFYWCGLLSLYLLFLLRILKPDTQNTERLSLVVILGIMFYIIKVLRSPAYFSNYDELLHYRTAVDIFNSNHLFKENPLLLVSPMYPGLEIVTIAFAKVSGASAFTSGVIVIGLAKIVLMLAMFKFYEKVSSSNYFAGVACLLYMANPYFLYFDSQFAYESLAIPLGMMMFYALISRKVDHQVLTLSFSVVVILASGALAITHHIGSFIFTALLFVWLIVSVAQNYLVKGKRLKKNVWTPFLSLAFSLAWMAFVGKNTVTYLSDIFLDPLQGVLDYLQGKEQARQLFHGAGGFVSPAWEQAVVYIAFFTILAALAYGLLLLMRRRQFHTDIVYLATVSLAYPSIQVFRLVDSGVELVNRSSGFIYIALAPIIALGICSIAFRPRLFQRLYLPISIAICLVFVSGSVLGLSPWNRLPGPYLSSAGIRSVDPLGIYSAAWASEYLGSGNRTAADYVNNLLMVSFGQQRSVTQSYDWYEIPKIYLAREIGDNEIGIFKEASLEYLVVDWRFTRKLPVYGIYYDRGENNSQPYRSPLSPGLLEKFDHQPEISRIYDAGDMIVYDVRKVK